MTAEDGRNRTHSALRALRHWCRLTERYGSLIGAFTGGSDIQEHAHYPDGDIRDPVSHTQCFYHCHSSDLKRAEHGHLHLFRRAHSHQPLTHLFAISLDAKGLPIGLFTVNRWVTDGEWQPAEQVMELMDALSLRNANCDPDLAGWMVHFTRMHRDSIHQLLLARDTCIDEQGEALADRSLEVLSDQAVDWMAEFEAIDRDRLLIRQAKQGA